MNHGEHGENFGEKRELKDCDESLIDSVLTAATNVHIYLGPGLLESDYEAALMYELPKLLGFKRGYLLNFNVKLLKEGIKRVSI
jgi:PD-(D/E)XK nuclease superfamily